MLIEFALILFWLALSVAAFFYAERLNRRGYLWGPAAVIFSRVIVFIVLFAVGTIEEHEEEDDDAA